MEPIQIVTVIALLMVTLTAELFFSFIFIIYISSFLCLTYTAFCIFLQKNRRFVETIQIVTVMGLPMVTLIAVSVSALVSTLNIYRESMRASTAIQECFNVADLVTALQVERGK